MKFVRAHMKAKTSYNNVVFLLPFEYLNKSLRYFFAIKLSQHPSVKKCCLHTCMSDAHVSACTAMCTQRREEGGDAEGEGSSCTITLKDVLEQIQGEVKLCLPH